MQVAADAWRRYASFCSCLGDPTAKLHVRRTQRAATGELCQPCLLCPPSPRRLDLFSDAAQNPDFFQKVNAFVAQQAAQLEGHLATKVCSPVALRRHFSLGDCFGASEFDEKLKSIVASEAKDDSRFIQRDFIEDEVASQ